jgi:hypothetical protein
MRPFVAVMLFLASSTIAHAQIKLAVFDPEQETKIKGVAFEDAKKAVDLKHGDLLALTLKDNKRVVGRLVRVDKKAKRLYLRRAAGMPPIPYDENQIAKLERGVKQAKGKGNNGIVAAADKTNVVNEPEIFTITEINGTLVTVRYFAPELSPGEQTQLKDTEAAENNAARKQYMMAQLLDTIGDQAMTLRLTAARQNEMMNIYITEQSWLSSFSPYLPSRFFGGGARDMLFSQSYAGTGGIMGGGSGVTSMATGMTSLMAKETALAADLTKANQALRTARSRGLYEGGELIAVLPPAEPAVMPAADKGQ